MPEVNFLQASFNSGELSPRFLGRSDLAIYDSGSRELLNMIPRVSGPLQFRHGTRYVVDALSQSEPGAIIPFEPVGVDPYIVELGDYKARIFSGDGVLVYGDVTVTAESVVNTVASQIELDDHGFYHGQKVRLKSASGSAPGGLTVGDDYYVVLPTSVRCTAHDTATEQITSAGDHYLAPEMGPYEYRHDNLGGIDQSSRYFVASLVSSSIFRIGTEKGGSASSTTTSSTGNMELVPTKDAIRNTFRLATDRADLFGSLVTFSSEGSGTIVIGPPDPETVILRTPWSAAQSRQIDFSQTVDVIFITHPEFPPYQLERFAESSFRLSRVDLVDGAYGENAPFGPSAELSVPTISQTANYNSVHTFTLSASEFSGTDVAQSLRKRYNAPATFEHQLVGRIERTTKLHTRLRPAVEAIVDRPSASTFVSSAHGLSDDERVFITAGIGPLPQELSERTLYFVDLVDADRFRLRASAGVAFIPLTDPGPGSESHRVVSAERKTVDDQDVLEAHPFSDGDDWCGLFSIGEPTGGLSAGIRYVVRVIDANSIYLEDANGSVVPVTGRGEGWEWLSGGVTDQVDVRLTIDPLSDDGKTTGHALATKDWRIGAWGARRGWPAKVGVSDDRLVFANSSDHPNRIWASQVGDPTNFSPDERTGTGVDPGAWDRTITDGSGFSRSILSGRTDEIQWIAQTQALLVGSKSSVAVLTSSSQREILTPANVHALVVSQNGTSDAKPALADDEVLFMSRCGCMLSAAGVSKSGGIASPFVLSERADHMFSVPTTRLVWSFEPSRALLAVQEDGRIRGCTFSQRDEVAGFFTIELGGVSGSDSFGHVEDAAVVAASEARSYDRVWLITSRTVNGKTVRFIEYLRNQFDIGDDLGDAAFLDAAPAPYSGPATTTLTGLDHLEGESVVAWADGSKQGPFTVAGGAIALASSASTVSVGLPYLGRWSGLNYEAKADQTVTLQTVRARVIEANIRLHRSVGGRIGEIGRGAFQPIAYYGNETAVPASPALFTGVVSIRPDSPLGRDSGIIVEQDSPAPMEILSVVARMRWGER